MAGTELVCDASFLHTPNVLFLQGAKHLMPLHQDNIEYRSSQAHRLCQSDLDFNPDSSTSWPVTLVNFNTECFNSSMKWDYYSFSRDCYKDSINGSK